MYAAAANRDSGRQRAPLDTRFLAFSPLPPFHSDTMAFNDSTLTTISPVDQSEVVSRQYPSSNAHLDHVVASAHAAHRAWRLVPLADRITLVHKAVDHLASRALELGPELTAQMGRPARYTAAEFATYKDRAVWLLNQAEAALKDQSVDQGRPEGIKRVIRRAPVGVCLLVGAWNVSLFVWTIGTHSLWTVRGEQVLTFFGEPARSSPVRAPPLRFCHFSVSIDRLISRDRLRARRHDSSERSHSGTRRG